MTHHARLPRMQPEALFGHGWSGRGVGVLAHMLVFRRQGHQVAEEGSGDEALFPWCASPRGRSARHVWMESCAANCRCHVLGVGPSCVLPSQGHASPASEVTVPRGPGRGGLSKLGPDCVRNRLFHLFQTHKAGFVPESSDVW